jgi:putative spermidine/putrescine transport system permease protein
MAQFELSNGPAPLRAKSRLHLSGRAWLMVAGAPILAYLLVPILIIIPMALTKSQLLMFPPQWISIRPFLDFFNDAQWVESTLTSLKVAILATAVASLAGATSALALHRSRIPGKGVIIAVILLPILIPVVVLALGDYLFFSRLGLSGGYISIGLAHSVMVTPYVFVAVQTSLAGLDPALHRAARSLGGGNLALLRYVYWPTIRPGVIGGALFAFIGSFDEVVVALFLSGPGVTTLPVQMFTSLQFDLSPKIAAVSSLLFILSIVALAAQAYQSLSGAREKSRAGTSSRKEVRIAP